MHAYAFAGNFDVRLTVTGAAGPAARQKPGFISVQPAARTIVRIGGSPAPPVEIDSRP